MRSLRRSPPSRRPRVFPAVPNLGALPAETPGFTASGARVEFTDGQAVDGALKRREGWQERAWELHDAIPEVRYYGRYVGDALARLNLYVGTQPDPEQDPRPVDDAGDDTLDEDSYTAQEAVDVKAALALIRSPQGGQSEIQRRLGVNIAIAGEAYLTGRPEDSQSERWDVYSVDQLSIDPNERRQNSAGVEVPSLYLRDGDTGKRQDLPPDTLAIRVWRSHPRYYEWADSPLRAAIGILEELLELTLAIRAASRSRIHGPGILFLPSSMRKGPPVAATPGNAGQAMQQDPVVTDLMTAAAGAIGDPGHPAGQVPVVVWLSDQLWEKVDSSKLVQWDREVDKIVAEQRAELLHRFSRVVDLPMEMMEGHQGTTFANAAQIDVDKFRDHLEPLAILICAALTESYLHPRLASLGMDDVDRFVVWFDPSNLVAEPDRSQTSKDAYELLAITGETYRRENGYSEEDAPEPDEILRRIAVMRAIKGGGQSQPDDSPAIGESEQPSDEEPIEEEPARPALVAVGRDHDLSLDGLTEQLAEMDVSLFRDTHAMCEAAVQRALERANAKLRGAAQKDRTAKSVIDGVHPGTLRIAPMLGPAFAQTLLAGADPFEGTFDEGNDQDPQNWLIAGLMGRYLGRVESTQGEALGMMDEFGEMDPLDRDHVDGEFSVSRAASWAILLGALGPIARGLLYRPEPERGPGETGPHLVPSDAVRNALIRAGGGGIDATGLLTGDLVREAWGRSGISFTGWTWKYGDPSWRKTQFAPHRRLNLVRFVSREDPRLENPGGHWPGVTHFWPKDHKGCMCITAVHGPIRTRALVPPVTSGMARGAR